MTSTDQTERASGAALEEHTDAPGDAPKPTSDHGIDVEPAIRSDRRLILASIALVLVPIVGALFASVGTTWYPASDLAIIEGQTMAIPSHPPLVGVFSRFNFHHPGPAMFYIYALPYRLLGPAGLLVGAALINAIALVGMVVFLHRRGGRSLLLIGTGALLVLELALAPSLIHPWNAYVAILPFALALVLAWSVWERDWWALPLLVATVSFTIQTHVGYALLGLWLAGTSTAWAIWSWARTARAGRAASTDLTVRPPAGPRLRVLLISGATTVVLWLPPLIDQLTRPPGNLRLLAGHFMTDHGAVMGWASAAGVYFRELGAPAPWLLFPEPVQPFIGGTEPGEAWWIIPVVVAFGAAIWWARRRGRGEALRLLILVGGSTAIGFVSVARITGDAYPYIIRWLWVLGVFAWLSIMWALRPRSVSPVARRAAMAGVPVLLIGLSLGGALRAKNTPLPDAMLSQAIAAVVGPTAEATRNRGTLLMLPEGGSWQEVQAGLLIELERRGVFPVVRDEDAFLYGDRRLASGRPIDGRIVVAVNEGVAARREKGAVPIAEYDPLSPAERDQLNGFVKRWSAMLEAGAAGRTVTDPLSADEMERFSSYQSRGQLISVYLDAGPLTGQDLAPAPDPALLPAPAG